jgi:hypothetical protein
MRTFSMQAIVMSSGIFTLCDAVLFASAAAVQTHAAHQR